MLQEGANCLTRSLSFNNKLWLFKFVAQTSFLWRFCSVDVNKFVLYSTYFQLFFGPNLELTTVVGIRSILFLTCFQVYYFRKSINSLRFSWSGFKSQLWLDWLYSSAKYVGVRANKYEPGLKSLFKWDLWGHLHWLWSGRCCPTRHTVDEVDVSATTRALIATVVGCGGCEGQAEGNR